MYCRHDWLRRESHIVAYEAETTINLCTNFVADESRADREDAVNHSIYSRGQSVLQFPCIPPCRPTPVSTTAIIRQLAQLRYLLAIFSLIACTFLYVFRQPFQNIFFSSLRAPRNEPVSPYTAIKPEALAMQSVKIVEAVTKQTGTVIFLHVCLVSRKTHSQMSDRLCRVSETQGRHLCLLQRSCSSNTRICDSSFPLRKRCRSL